jgi:endonuclease-3
MAAKRPAKNATKTTKVTKPTRALGKPAKAAKPASRPKRPRGPALRAHAALLLDRLLGRYPDAHCALDFSNAFQLLCATILSAQCTDKRVNMVTPALFARYPDARSLAAARQEDVEELIKSTGFFRNKAKSLIRDGDGGGGAPRRRGAGPTWMRSSCCPASAARPRTSSSATPSAATTASSSTRTSRV